MTRNVLVVDDSPTMRVALRRQLELRGFTVFEASHGQDALEQLEALPTPGLMMVDWRMPVMNGLEFVQQVRLSTRFDDTRVIMVTTENERDAIMTALDAGADEYIMKPFSSAMLEDKLGMVGLNADGAQPTQAR